MARDELVVRDAQPVESWKPKMIIVGGLIGALVGLGSTYLLAENMERTGRKPTISTREGFSLAVLLFGVIRSVANLWQD